MFNTKQITLCAAIIASFLITGCATKCPRCENNTKTIYVDKYIDKPAQIQHFPKEKIAAAAPQSSKLRCESLPKMTVEAGSATTKQLLIEINKARSSYADCANRHNVLVDFNEQAEQSLLNVLNHYQSQK